VRRMSRLGIVIALVSVLFVSACGGSGGSSSSSSSSSSGGSGSASASAQGKQVFTSAGCKGCHTLKDAGATGTVGPNLDDLKPNEARVKRQVIKGGGPMPSFKGKLSNAQIDAVSAYVSSVAGKS
jgi:mono/diheme cytochrome c family protein